MRVDSKGRTVHDCIVSNTKFGELLNSSCNWFSGVPDSMYTKLIPLLSPYHFAPRENHAVAMAFGARLTGARPCVLMQNSGIGLCIDALLGLQRLYQKGIVLLVTLRGELAWEEVQHQDWGQCTLSAIQAFEFDLYDYSSLGTAAISAACENAYQHERISIVLLHRGNLDE